MIVALIIVFVISGTLLILVIALQDDQGGGVGGIFGGGSGSAFGSRSGNVMTKITSVLAAIFMIVALSVAWLSRSNQDEDIEARARIKSLREQEDIGWYMKSDQSEAGGQPEETVESEETEKAVVSPAAEEEKSLSDDSQTEKPSAD